MWNWRFHLPAIIVGIQVSSFQFNFWQTFKSVTSRNSTQVLISRPITYIYIFRLTPTSNVDCWQIFSQYYQQLIQHFKFYNFVMSRWVTFVRIDLSNGWVIWSLPSFILWDQSNIIIHITYKHYNISTYMPFYKDVVPTGTNYIWTADTTTGWTLWYCLDIYYLDSQYTFQDVWQLAVSFISTCFHIFCITQL